MSKQTPWEKAKKLAEKECPYPAMPAGEDRPQTGGSEWDELWDKDNARYRWVPGAAFGLLGVPNQDVCDREERYFWQGYEWGVAKANGGAK